MCAGIRIVTAFVVEG